MSNTPLWQTPQLTRPSLRGSVRVDLCVVGLGGSGLAAIQAGINAGMRVIGLDAGQLASGAAGRNGGFLLAGPAWFHHDARLRVGKPLAREFYQSTVEELARMQADPTVRRVGSLRIAGDDTEHEDIERHLDALREDGFAAERYRGPEGEGLLVPGDAVFDPFGHCVWQAEKLERRGARLFECSRVLRVEQGCVHTARGEVRATHTLLAVDGGLNELAPSLSDRVTTWRLQMLATAPLGRRVSPYAVYSRHGYDYWHQRPDGGIALGGGRDIGGETEREGELKTTAVVQAHLEHVLREKLGVDSEITHRWAGRVGYTADGLPLCEPLENGTIAIGGYCGTGNIIGRILGREVVERWSGGPAPFISALQKARAFNKG